MRWVPRTGVVPPRVRTWQQQPDPRLPRREDSLLAKQGASGSEEECRWTDTKTHHHNPQAHRSRPAPRRRPIRRQEGQRAPGSRDQVARRSCRPGLAARCMRRALLSSRGVLSGAAFHPAGPPTPMSSLAVPTLFVTVRFLRPVAESLGAIVAKRRSLDPAGDGPAGERRPGIIATASRGEEFPAFPEP